MKVKLLDVRLSFPNLFKAKSVNGSEPKYGASFILNKQDDLAQINALRAACQATAKEQWPTKIPPGVKYCVHDGAEKEYDGYGPEVIYLSANSTIAPPVVDENLNPVTGDGKVYAGCRVNAVIRLWAQDNQFGKRINAQLQAVQFSGDGEAFGEKPINPHEEFTAANPQASATGDFKAAGKTKQAVPMPKAGTTAAEDYPTGPQFTAGSESDDSVPF